MQIAIHYSQWSFSVRWVDYCKKHNISYKIVNCYNTNIVDELKDCDALMWHFSHGDYKDVLFAKALLFSLEQAGIKVFPNFNTVWHFDDKVGQKYLFEAIGAPMVPSFIFYSKNEALKWVNETSFPKVFKLRTGAGSANVKLVRTKSSAKKIIRQSFGNGISQFDSFANFKERVRKVKEGKDSYIGILKGIGRFFIPTEFAKMHAPEKGYVYFQDFIPNNRFDIRVIVIGNKAFAIKRLTRKNDFRASGSGNIIYDKNQIDKRCIEISFEINKTINSQCIGYDFLFDEMNTPRIVEISYGFTIKVYDPCPGYWTSDLEWHSGNFQPQWWIIEDLINSIN